MCAYSRVAPWWRRERSGEMVTAATSGVVGQCERVCSCGWCVRHGVCSVGTPAQNSSEVSSATVTENQPRDTRKSTSRGGAPIRAGDARRMQRRRRGRPRRPGPFPRTSPPNLVTRPCGLDPHVARVRSVSELNMLQLAANCQRSRVGGHLQRSAQRKRHAFWSPISHCILHLGAPRILEPHACAATQLAPISLVATQLAPISP